MTKDSYQSDHSSVQAVVKFTNIITIPHDIPPNAADNNNKCLDVHKFMNESEARC